MSFPALRLGLLYFIICFPGSQAFQHGLEPHVAIVCVCVCIHSHILSIYVADYICIYIKCRCAVRSVVPDSLRPHGLLPTRLLCSWISQAGILEWVIISSSRGSSPPRDQPVTPASPALAGRSLPLSHMGSPIYNVCIYIYIYIFIKHIHNIFICICCALFEVPQCEIYDIDVYMHISFSHWSVSLNNTDQYT